MTEYRATYYSEILERDLMVDIYTGSSDAPGYSVFIKDDKMNGYSHKLKNLFECITDEDKENYGEGNIIDNYSVAVIMPMIFDEKKLSKEVEREIIEKLGLPEMSFEIKVTKKFNKDNVDDFLNDNCGGKKRKSDDEDTLENLIGNAATLNRIYYDKRNKILSPTELGFEKGSKSTNTIYHIRREGNASEEAIFEMIINRGLSFEDAEKILWTKGKSLLTPAKRSRIIKRFIKNKEEHMLKGNYTLDTLNTQLEKYRIPLIK